MKKSSKTIRNAFAIAILAIASILIVLQNKNMPYQVNQGMTFGTFYKITYQHDKDMHASIKRAFRDIDNTLSMFERKSVVSAINDNRQARLNKMFIEVFQMSQHISKDTDGAFDATVAPLVNAWGFGFKENKLPTRQDIDSIMKFVGYEKISLIGKAIKKTDKRVMLDFSAIAKGYSADVIARLFRSEGIKNFMIEIGGEIVVAGNNPANRKWSIGIEKPIDDSLATKSELQTIIKVNDMAMATSGNYRNFYYKNGKKYAHTINPKTGFPVQHNILSATVLAKQCAVADAYATAFMVMGLENAKKILSARNDIKAYFIYDNNGEFGVWKSEGL